MSDISPEQHLENLRDRLTKAQVALLRAVSDACPGEHWEVRHRDGKPPWCHSCGRDARGERQADPDG